MKTGILSVRLLCTVEQAYGASAKLRLLSC